MQQKLKPRTKPSNIIDGLEIECIPLLSLPLFTEDIVIKTV